MGVGAQALACACARVALSYLSSMQRACAMLSAPLWLHHIFRDYLINCTIFAKRKVSEHKMCLDFLHNVYLKHFSFREESSEILS
jgi:hypothetical protein